MLEDVEPPSTKIQDVQKDISAGAGEPNSEALPESKIGQVEKRKDDDNDQDYTQFKPFLSFEPDPSYHSRELLSAIHEHHFFPLKLVNPLPIGPSTTLIWIDVAFSFLNFLKSFR